MKKILNILNKIWHVIYNPNRWMLIALFGISIVCLIATIYLHVNYDIYEINLAGYSLSGVLLAYSIIYTSIYSYYYYNSNLKDRLIQIPLFKAFISNYGIRTFIFSCFSTLINISFALANGIRGIMYHSKWYGSLAGYLVFLIMLRFSILLITYLAMKRHKTEPNKIKKIKQQSYLVCGAWLLILEIPMTVAIIQMVRQPHVNTMGEIFAIATAGYAFFKFTLAIVNFRKAKKLKDPMVQSLRNINIADALITMISLTSLLLTQFSEEANKLVEMKYAVGASSIVLISIMAIIMIIQANKNLKKLNEIEE